MKAYLQNLEQLLIYLKLMFGVQRFPNPPVSEAAARSAAAEKDRRMQQQLEAAQWGGHISFEAQRLSKVGFRFYEFRF